MVISSRLCIFSAKKRVCRFFPVKKWRYSTVGSANSMEDNICCVSGSSPDIAPILYLFLLGISFVMNAPGESPGAYFFILLHQ